MRIARNDLHHAFTRLHYHDTLMGRFPFYDRLADTDKEKFVKRLGRFAKARDFFHIGLDPSPEVPVLISAAAVQLTFGLRRYRLPYFAHIYIHREAFRFRHDPNRLIGHVAEQGAVHLSWKHFLAGYGNYTDKQNVGLHEMAHALEYSTFVIGSNINRKFVRGFEAFRVEGWKEFYKLYINGSDFFSDYAATHFQEFWAECVECFFEAPHEFRQQLPALYDVLCRMLNQDPANGVTKLH